MDRRSSEGLDRCVIIAEEARSSCVGSAWSRWGFRKHPRHRTRPRQVFTSRGTLRDSSSLSWARMCPLRLWTGLHWPPEDCWFPGNPVKSHSGGGKAWGCPRPGTAPRWSGLCRDQTYPSGTAGFVAADEKRRDVNDSKKKLWPMRLPGQSMCRAHFNSNWLSKPSCVFSHLENGAHLT